MTALALGLAIPASAQATSGIGTHGPLTEASGWFPEWYQDSAGTRLSLCVDGPYCLATMEAPLPEPDQPSRFPDNFPDEAFWWSADSTLTYPGGSALMTMAQEAAFANGAVVPGDQIAFGRLRIRATGLVPNAWYRFTYPYGQIDLQATDKAPRVVNYTSDAGCLAAPCADDAFSQTSGSLIGPDFLQWDATESTPPEGYIGNPAVSHRVTGSRFVPAGESEPANYFGIERITGPGGTVLSTVGRTDYFLLQGQLAGAARGHFAATPVQFGDRRVGSSSERTATIRNTGSGDLVLGTPRVSGDDVDDFALAPGGTCALPGTLAPGETCTLRVSFAPAAARDHSARIELPEDAADGPATRSITLSGSGTAVPAPVVASPPATAAAAPSAATAPAPAALVPGAGTAVLGATATSRAAIRGLTMRAALGRARARTEGLRLVMRIAGDANIVRVRVYRMHGEKRGARIAQLYRSPTANPVRLRLSDPALRRRLTPGTYRIEIAAGTGRSELGAAAARTLRVK